MLALSLQGVGASTNEGSLFEYPGRKHPICYEFHECFDPREDVLTVIL